MKIQYCSDLHLEFIENNQYLKANPILAYGDILVLAGDVTLLKTQHNHTSFFKQLSKKFNTVYWLPGNHEYYHYDIGDMPFSFCNEVVKNVFFINNVTKLHGNVELIFSTLWSQIPVQHEYTVQRSVSDFTYIKKNGKTIMPADFNAMHNADVAFLETQFAKPLNGKKRVVVTHHVPTLTNYPRQYIGSQINGAFATELYNVIENSQANYWIYGHHHCNIPAFNIGKTTMLTNQLGYVRQKENELFDSSKVIDL